MQTGETPFIANERSATGERLPKMFTFRPDHFGLGHNLIAVVRPKGLNDSV
jgi:hypothetical protein